MSFLNKSGFRSKPSLVKPILVIVAILLVIGGAYSLFSTKTQPSENADAKKEQAADVQPSGLDKDMDVDDVEDVEKVVAKWIEANPKAIIASVTNMQKKAMEDQMKDAQKTISTKTKELFEDPNSPAYSPEGYDVSIVEFFDYSCGYCKKAQSSVAELLSQDKKVRVIYKEYPILGQASKDMSVVAVAVHLTDPSAYKKFHETLMKSNVRNKDEAIKVAKANGVNGEKLEKTLKNDQAKIEKILQENAVLGASIGISGTPGFVVGEELIPGAVDADTFKEKIAALRNKK